jgi:hypothetical protein
MQRHRYIHALVTEAFIGPYPHEQEVRHKDGNRLNNNLDNLEYGTHLENGADTIKHGRTTYGERNTNAKLSEEQVFYILESTLSASVLAKQFGVNQDNIYAIRTRKAWRYLNRSAARAGWRQGTTPLSSETLRRGGIGYPPLAFGCRRACAEARCQ